MPKHSLHSLKIERAPSIGYTNQYRRSCFGIYYDKLRKYQRLLLVSNPIMKNRTDDDDFVYAIFKAFNPNKKNKDVKVYWDVTTESFVPRDKLLKNYNTIEWRCAISGEPIRSSIDNFDLENFVHPDYHDVLDAPMVDSRILKSSVGFRKHIKKLLMIQQKEFLKYARKNSKL